MPHPSDRTRITLAVGELEGRRSGPVDSYLGIPYAAPPIGPLRFGRPSPASPWSGVRAATAFGPAVPQTPMPGIPTPPEALPGGDDWLTLNVWAPNDTAGAPFPVLVFVHGGAYLNGSSADPSYDAALLAEHARAAVVTVNYRVSVEGFGVIEGAVANRGLLDIVAALEWTQRNISGFGGDASRVTLLGQSAGAGCVAALLAMPSARGLFHRAIVQSLPSTYLSPELAADVTAHCFVAAGLGPHPSLAEASQTDPHELASAAASVVATTREQRSWGQLAAMGTPFAPVIDGEILPATPWRAIADGAANDIDLLTGHTRDEYRVFLVLAGLLGHFTDEQAGGLLHVLGPAGQNPDAYRAAYPDADASQLVELVFSDYGFRMPTLALAQAHAAAGGRTYLYELTWPAPANGGLFGACHILDASLLFGAEDAGLGAALIGAENREVARAVSTPMRKAWGRFAATGDPGWAPFDQSEMLTEIIDAEWTTLPYPEARSARLWADTTFTALPLHT